jgi:hypothetical protein
LRLARTFTQMMRQRAVEFDKQMLQLFDLLRRQRRQQIVEHARMAWCSLAYKGTTSVSQMDFELAPVV